MLSTLRTIRRSVHCPKQSNPPLRTDRLGQLRAQHFTSEHTRHQASASRSRSTAADRPSRARSSSKPIARLTQIMLRQSESALATTYLENKASDENDE